MIQSFDSIVLSITAFILAYSAYLAKKSIDNFKQTEKLNISIEVLGKLDYSGISQKANMVLAIIEDEDNPVQGENLAFNASQQSHDKRDSKLLKNAIDLIQYLNHLENLAIGIKQNIYDEKTIWMSIESRVIRTYLVSSSFVNKYRKYSQDNELWLNFEELALKWQKQKKEKSSPNNQS